MTYTSVFKMPVPMKITGRSSSITNAFVNSIIPIIKPSEDEIVKSLDILEMTPESIECSYCGGKYTEWDHLRPLVLNKLPTGYVSEIQNLVPSCGKCNQSKGNKEWKSWILSDANLSPKTRNIEDINIRIVRLDNYSLWKSPTKIIFSEAVEDFLWSQHWENCNKIQSLLIEAQKVSEKIKINLSHDSIVQEDGIKRLGIIPSDEYDSVKIGKLVQSYIPKIIQYLSSSNLSEVNRLQDRDYSKNMFGLNFPFFLEVELNSIKKLRYWKQVYNINGKYYVVTSEWYDTSLGKFKSYVKNKKL